MSKNITLHAHVYTYARDCDGGHGHDYVAGFNDAEIAEHKSANGVNDFSDIHFMERVMMSVASPYSVTHGMRITVDNDGIDVHESTDEGVRQASVQWCRDESCDPNAESVSDEYAEAMGY